MKRTFPIAKSLGSISCFLPEAGETTLPVFAGILKHPSAEDLPRILLRPEVAVRYTDEALRTAPWQILKEFPAGLLRSRIEAAGIRPGRRQALEFLLGDR